jgi:hypothetical protein
MSKATLFKIPLFFILFFFIAIPNSKAQSKKTLKSNIKELIRENEALRDSLIETTNKIYKLEQDLSLQNELKTTIGNANKHINTTSGDSIAEIIASFFTAENWEHRLQYVDCNDSIQKIFSNYYSVHGNYSPSSVDVSSLTGRKINIEEGATGVVKVGDNYVYIIRKNGKYLIDWFATTGYNEMRYIVFRTKEHNHIATMRVVAKLSNHFNYNYRDMQDAYWSIALSTTDFGKTFHSYLKKGTKDAALIYNILKDGDAHHLIIEIKMDKSKEKNGNVSTINKFVSNSWLMSPILN